MLVWKALSGSLSQRFNAAGLRASAVVRLGTEPADRAALCSDADALRTLSEADRGPERH